MSIIRVRSEQVKAKLVQLAERFPTGDCVLVSVQSETYTTVGGMTMEMPIENAARHMVEGTHRLATDAEINTFRDQQVAARAAIEASAAARGCVYVRKVE